MLKSSKLPNPLPIGNVHHSTFVFESDFESLLLDELMYLWCGGLLFQQIVQVLIVSIFLNENQRKDPS